MSLPVPLQALPIMPLRVLASRAVLARGLDTRQLLELPHPLDREMEAYSKMQGTYFVKSTIVKIEQVLAPLNVGIAAEVVRKILARNFGLIQAGQNIVVHRPSKDEWTVKHCLGVSRFLLRSQQRVTIRGVRAFISCYPEDGRLELAITAKYMQQNTIKLDRQGSLVWTLKFTNKMMTFTWTCRTSRLRRSSRKQKK